MPSYAPAKPKPIKRRKLKPKILNLEWLSRAARARASITTLRNSGMLDAIEDQHALMAIAILDSMSKRSTNRSAAKQIADAEKLTLIAMGFRYPVDIG